MIDIELKRVREKSTHWCATIVWISTSQAKSKLLRLVTAILAMEKLVEYPLNVADTKCCFLLKNAKKTIAIKVEVAAITR